VQPPRKSRASQARQKITLSELHTFQRLHTWTQRACRRNLQTTSFACGPISFRNAAADLLCLATRSPIGLKRSDSCSSKRVAKIERAAHNERRFGRSGGGAARTTRSNSGRGKPL